MLSSALPFHAFSGCDTTSAFARKRKLKPLKTLKKQTLSIRALKKLGQAVQLEEETERDLEKFVCCMHQKRKYDDFNKLRADMFKQKFKPKNHKPFSSSTGIDLSLLPPFRDSLHMHILKCNYEVLIWKSAAEPYPKIPSPIGIGWKMDDDKLIIQWNNEEILPPKLIEIFSAEPEHVSSDDEEIEDIEVNNYDDIIFEEDADGKL